MNTARARDDAPVGRNGRAARRFRHDRVFEAVIAGQELADRAADAGLFVGGHQDGQVTAVRCAAASMQASAPLMSQAPSPTARSSVNVQRKRVTRPAFGIRHGIEVKIENRVRLAAHRQQRQLPSP